MITFFKKNRYRFYLSCHCNFIYGSTYIEFSFWKLIITLFIDGEYYSANMEPDGEYKIIVGSRNIVLNATKEYKSRKKRAGIEKC